MRVDWKLFAVVAAAVVMGAGLLLALRGDDESGPEAGPCQLSPRACANVEKVAPDPGGLEQAETIPDDVEFGFNEGPPAAGMEADTVELARAAGAKAVRFPVDWRLLERERDVWNEEGWAAFGAYYDAILAAGMTPVINFGWAPQWARDPGPPQACFDWSGCRYPPAETELDEWSEFAAEVAKRFPRAVLEVWNEPNLIIFWRSGPDPERFATLQAAAYDAIKDVSPRARVLAGGFANVQEAGTPLLAAGPGDMPMREFIDRAYAATPSIADHMDAISFHPYPYSTDLGAGSIFAKSFEDVRAAAADAGDAGRRIWVSEVGLPSAGLFAVGEDEQADTLLRMYRRMATMTDVDGILVHRLVPPVGFAPESTDSGYALLREPGVGGAAKPAFCELVDVAESSYEGC